MEIHKSLIVKIGVLNYYSRYFDKVCTKQGLERPVAKTDIDTEDDIDLGDEQSKAPPPPVSPLIKLINALKGKKADSDSATVPAATNKKAPANTPATSKKKGAPAAAEEAPVTIPSGPLATILTRNEFYRDGFRNLLRLVLLQAVVIVGLVLTFIFYMGMSESQDRYFATTADGRIMQLTPLDQPNMNTAALMSWVAQATSEVMTFGYHDYQRRLQQSSRHFTRRGWETFTAAMQQARVFDTVESAKEVASASPRNAPVLVQQGVFNGKYRWIVKMSLQVSYVAVSGNRSEGLALTLVIDRVPSLENPNGVGIEQWIAVAE